MAAADGDRGAVVRLLAALAAAGLQGACATATDETDNSQPAVTTTIDAILQDPESWEGKRVLLVGWTDSDHAVLSTSSQNLLDGLGLEPAKHYRQRGFVTGSLDTATRVAVSGQVDLSCINWFKQAVPDATYAEMREGPPVFTHLDHLPPQDGPLGFCAFMVAPYLIDVVVTNAKAAP